MALVDTMVEQRLISSAGGGPGDERVCVAVQDVCLVGGVGGWGLGVVGVRPSSPRPTRLQHRGIMSGPVSGKTARWLQQRGATVSAGGEEDRVRRLSGSDGDSCVCEDE